MTGRSAARRTGRRTARRTSRRVSRRQSSDLVAAAPLPEEAPPPTETPAAPPPPAPTEEDKYAKLKEAKELPDAGIPTEEEFAAEKAKILG